MKPIRTPDCNVTLTLPGGTEDNDMPAQQAMIYDTSIGQTQEDAQLGWVTRWMPTEDEARKIEAGAAVELTIFGKGHPPVSLSVTAAVLPESELVARGRVERALGKLYSDLKEDAARRLADLADRLEAMTAPPEIADVVRPVVDAMLPSPAGFADLWEAALDATREDHERATSIEQTVLDGIHDTRRRNGHDPAGG